MDQHGKRTQGDTCGRCQLLPLERQEIILEDDLGSVYPPNFLPHTVRSGEDELRAKSLLAGHALAILRTPLVDKARV